MSSSPLTLSFPSLQESFKKPLQVTFEGPDITSDAGWLLLAQVDRELKLTERLADCLDDRRNPAKVQHSTLDLFRQRVYQIAAGYEDANDADTLRSDPLLKIVHGRASSDDDLASQPTLSRFENDRTRRELFRLGEAFYDLFVEERKGRRPRSIVIDLDGTEDEVHGAQQLSFFNGHVGNHCFFPLVILVTCDEEIEQVPLGMILRAGNSGAAKGTLPILKRLVSRLRKQWPGVQLRVRLDGGFACPEIYAWLEAQSIGYVINLPQNRTLRRLAEPLMKQARALQKKRGGTVRLFGQICYRAKSWNRSRRVIVKAEVMPTGDNPRFLVTSIHRGTAEKQYRFYTRRGDVENRIKEFKGTLAGDRTSCSRFDANQFRLVLHLAAYRLWLAIRRRLSDTGLERAQVDRLIVTLMKVGAWVQETTRAIRVRISASHPFQLYWKRLVPA